MMFISTRIHGLLDYLEAVALILAPNIFRFGDVGGMAVFLPRFLGVGLLLYSLLTNYEFGLFRVLSMRTHLILDFVAGALLALSPFIFGFSTEKINAWVPHAAVGLVVIFVVLFSQSEPRVAASRRRRKA